MLGTPFYDEIYAEQRHMRVIAHICREAPTEEEIVLLPDPLLAELGRKDEDSAEPVGQETPALLLPGGCGVPLRDRTIRLFEEAPECLLAETMGIPYTLAPTEGRRVRTRSQTRLVSSISAKELRSCCLPWNVPLPQYPPRFRGRHYRITGDGDLVLVPDGPQGAI